MYHQLLTYNTDAITSPRNPGPNDRANSCTQTVTTASMTNSAGSSRRARRSQKFASPIRPRAVHCPTRMSVIR